MPLAFGVGSGYPGLGQNLPQYVGQTPGGADPNQYRNEALKRLSMSLTGPYDEAWQQGQINRGADALAKGSEQQMEELRNNAASRGLAFNDPSLQAEQRRISEGRRTAVQGLSGDVHRQAQGANYAGGLQASNAILNQTENPYGNGGYTSYRPHVMQSSPVFTPRRAFSW